MQTRSHTRGEHIPALPFEVWVFVLNIMCKTADDFPERCRLQCVCRAFRIDEYTPFPRAMTLSLFLTSNVRIGFLNAMVTCKHAFANIMELNLYGSLMSNKDQLALSAVNWPHLGKVNLNNSGIFDRPCALFLKQWLHTIRDSVRTVSIEISSRGIDFLTFFYIWKWINDSRVKYVAVVGNDSSVYPRQYFEEYRNFETELYHKIRFSCDDYLAVDLRMGDIHHMWTYSSPQIVKLFEGSKSTITRNIERIVKNSKDFHCTSTGPRCKFWSDECPMEQDWYMRFLDVNIINGKPRSSCRSNMSIFSHKSSY
jgi:hypothetical protein